MSWSIVSIANTCFEYVFVAYMAVCMGMFPIVIVKCIAMLYEEIVKERAQQTELPTHSQQSTITQGSVLDEHRHFKNRNVRVDTCRLYYPVDEHRHQMRNTKHSSTTAPVLLKRARFSPHDLIPEDPAHRALYDRNNAHHG